MASLPADFTVEFADIVLIWHFNINIIFSFFGIYSVQFGWAAHLSVMSLFAVWLIRKDNEKAALHINMPHSPRTHFGGEYASSLFIDL